ncbi:MAG: Uma2 family endonuclease [Desulfobacterales bacterium]|nr:Uma2 family endonuclease [Desulfobacterales bacterium]
MLTSIKTNATYEDLYHIPENMIGEIIDGELYVMPRPAPKHCNTASSLGIVIGYYYKIGMNGGTGGWWILDEPEIHFSDLKEDFIVPDIAGWKKEKMFDLPKETYFSIPPDWVCEILSPGTATHDRKKKLPKYAKFGVTHFWIVDPTNKTVEILKLKNGEYVVLEVYGENDKMRTEPFTEILIDLINIW